MPVRRRFLIPLMLAGALLAGDCTARLGTVARATNSEASATLQP